MRMSGIISSCAHLATYKAGDVHQRLRRLVANKFCRLTLPAWRMDRVDDDGGVTSLRPKGGDTVGGGLTTGSLYERLFGGSRRRDRVMCVEGRPTAGRTAISRLRMYFRFDNSILAPAVFEPSANGKNNPRRLRRVSFRRFIDRPAGRKRFVSLKQKKWKKERRERERERKKGNKGLTAFHRTALIPVYLCVKRTRASSGARNNALSNDVKNGKNFQTAGTAARIVFNGTRVILSPVFAKRVNLQSSLRVRFTATIYTGSLCGYNIYSRTADSI